MSVIEPVGGRTLLEQLRVAAGDGNRDALRQLVDTMSYREHVLALLRSAVEERACDHVASLVAHIEGRLDGCRPGAGRRLRALLTLGTAVVADVDGSGDPAPDALCEAVRLWTGVVVGDPRMLAAYQESDGTSSGALVRVASDRCDRAGPSPAAEILAFAELSKLLASGSPSGVIASEARFLLRLDGGGEAPVGVIEVARVDSAVPAAPGVVRGTLAMDVAASVARPETEFVLAVETAWHAVAARHPRLLDAHIRWRVGVGSVETPPLMSLDGASVGLAAAAAMLRVIGRELVEDGDVPFTGPVDLAGRVHTLGWNSGATYGVKLRGTTARRVVVPHADTATAQHAANRLPESRRPEVTPVRHIDELVSRRATPEPSSAVGSLRALSLVGAISLVVGTVYGYTSAPAVVATNGAGIAYERVVDRTVRVDLLAGAAPTRATTAAQLMLSNARAIDIYPGGGIVIGDAVGLWWVKPDHSVQLLAEAESGPIGEIDALAAAPDGAVFVVSSANNTVTRVTPAGKQSRPHVTTYAGSGSAGSGGDGGHATQAQLNRPAGVAVDATGGLYISEKDGHRIRHVSRTRMISTFAGNGTTRDALDGEEAARTSTACPTDLDVADDGSVYFVDSCYDRVRVIGRDKRIGTFAGNGEEGRPVAGDSALLSPMRPVSVEVAGPHVYLSDKSHAVLRVERGRLFVAAGEIGVSGTGGPSGRAQGATLDEPAGVAFGNGNLYIADAANGIIRRVAGDEMVIAAGRRRLADTAGEVAVDRIDLRGPQGVTQVGRHLYVADTLNHVVRRVSLDTNRVVTVAGTGQAGSIADGADAQDALRSALRYPIALAADPTNRHLYIVDYGNHAVRRLDLETSRMTTLLGVAGREGSELTGDAATTRLRFPRDVDIARDGIVVTDSGNNRVLLVNAVGVVTTVAGTGDAGFSGDGGDAGDAELANPNGAAVEADGDILIADYDNRRIRRVSGGVISTFAGSGGYGPYGDRSGVPLLDADFKPRSVVSDGPRTYVAAPDGIWLLVDGSAIRLLDADGQQLAESPPTTAELGSPWALIVLGSREIATVDGTRNAVVRIRH